MPAEKRVLPLMRTNEAVLRARVRGVGAHGRPRGRTALRCDGARLSRSTPSFPEAHTSPRAAGRAAVWETNRWPIVLVQRDPWDGLPVDMEL